MNLQELNDKTLEWSEQRGITTNGKATTQFIKLVEEVGELATNLNKGLDCRDDIGDCLVVLTNMSKLLGTSLEECWNIAYNDIKDRQGYLTAEGNFIKQTKMEFDDGEAK